MQPHHPPRHHAAAMPPSCRFHPDALLSLRLVTRASCSWVQGFQVCCSIQEGIRPLAIRQMASIPVMRSWLDAMTVPCYEVHLPSTLLSICSMEYLTGSFFKGRSFQQGRTQCRELPLCAGSGKGCQWQALPSPVQCEETATRTRDLPVTGEEAGTENPEQINFFE